MGEQKLKEGAGSTKAGDLFSTSRLNFLVGLILDSLTLVVDCVVLLSVPTKTRSRTVLRGMNDDTGKGSLKLFFRTGTAIEAPRGRHGWLLFPETHGNQLYLINRGDVDFVVGNCCGP